MPEFAIEISLVKIVDVEADNIELAKEKVLESFNDGLHDMWTFDVETKLYEEYEPIGSMPVDDETIEHFKKVDKKILDLPNIVITQEELDTCDGGITRCRPDNNPNYNDNIIINEKRNK